MFRRKPSGTGFALAPIGAALFLCALICALPAQAGTTWDGGGANSSWGTQNNWSSNGLPLFNGTETITLGTGFNSGTTITLDGTRYINDLVISTITGFTLSAGTGGTLNLRSGNITRQDVGGTEAVQTISAGMILGDPTGVAAYTGTWNIAGSNSLDITGNIGEAGGSRAISKTGAGTVILSGTNTFSGGVTLGAGTVSISSDANLGAASGAIRFNGGTLEVTQNVTGSRAVTMTGAGTFDVALGKTIQESGAVTGNGALSLINYGTLILSGSGSNGTGTTNIMGILSLRGTVALGTGNFAFTTGILELGNGNFTRALGVGAGQVNMSTSISGAGFAAFGADRIVNLGGSGATVTWGAGNFLPTGQVLYFGTATADHTLDLQNGINLNGASRSIQTLRGVGSVPEGKISGVISGAGTSNLSFDAVPGYTAGSVLLSNGGNSYAGTTTVNAGNLLLTANATGTAGNTVLGSGSSDILVGNTSGTYDAGLLTNSSVTISRNVRAQSGNTGVITLGGNSASASTFSGSIFLGTNSGAGKGVTLTAPTGGTTTFSGVIQDPTSVVGPALVRKSGAGTVVLSGINTYAGGTSIDGGTLSISQSSNLGANTGGLTLNAGTLEITSGFSTNRVFTVADATSTFQIDPSQTFTVTSAITGSGGLTKVGTGTMVLSGANSFTGATTVSAGTLTLSDGSGSALGSTSSIKVNSGGTLLVSANNQINNAATMTLAGGTLRISGAQEGTTAATGVGALTLNSSSVIDLAGTSLLHLAASNGQAWTGTLSIYNWNGTPKTGGGAEQLLFGTNTTALTQTQLNSISFYSDNGTTFLGTGGFAPVGNGEIVPVPEPATYVASLLVFGVLVRHQRKRIRRLIPGRSAPR
jgi:autotransporter-associated beta strand protein